MKFHHILWDFDGTLFDTYPETARSMEQALGERGIKIGYQELYDMMKVSLGKTMSYLADELGADEEVFRRYQQIRRAREVQPGVCRPYDGISEILEKVIAGGGYNYMCTHRDDSALNILKAYKMENMFREMVTAENHFAPKPDPQGVNYLLDKYGISRSDAVMVGDRELDIGAGKNAGIATISFWDGTGKPCTSGLYSASSVSEISGFLGF